MIPTEKGSSDVTGKVVVVAVRASKEISRTALVWALTHVVQPADCIKLLVLIPALSTSTFSPLYHFLYLSIYLPFLTMPSISLSPFFPPLLIVM